MADQEKTGTATLDAAIHTPEIYEQAFELNTTGLNDEEIDRLRRKAYQMSAERLQQVVSSIAPTAWPKYLYYRIKICMAPAVGQPSSEEIGRRFMTIGGALDEATGQPSNGNKTYTEPAVGSAKK